MKRQTIIMMALALVLGMAQCRKNVEQVMPGGQTTGEKVYVTLNVDLGDTKTEIDATGNVKWKSGDKIYVVGDSQGLLGSIQPSNLSTPSATATFSGIISNISSTQYLRFYYVGDNSFTLTGDDYTFSIGTQDGTLDGIAESNQIMWGKSASLIAAGATELGSVTMTSLIAIAHLDINDGGAAVSGPVTVTGGKASATFDAKTYDGSALSGTAGNITMTLASGTTSTNCYIALLPGAQTLKFSANGKEATLDEKTVVANQFYNSGTAIAVSVEAPAGPQAVGWTNAASPKSFSVSSTKKVYFSQGNLQWSRTNGTGANTTHTTAGNNSSSPLGNEGTWRFAEHQFDYIGSGNGNISPTYSGWIDLFGWATSGWNARTSGTCYYMPYETSTDRSYYGPPTSGNPSLTGTYANSDWGVYNDISNDGTLGVGAWRTLTTGYSGEWRYLVGVRTNASTLCGKGKVENICGLIILPDDFNWTSAGLSQWTSSGPESEYTDNVYTYSEWHAMETEGAVFLPAAGYRNSSTISGVGTSGYYWSVSGSGEPTKLPRSSAISMEIYNGRIYSNMQTDENRGCSVRLVKDAN